MISITYQETTNAVTLISSAKLRHLYKSVSIRIENTKTLP